MKQRIYLYILCSFILGLLMLTAMKSCSPKCIQISYEPIHQTLPDSSAQTASIHSPLTDSK